MTALSFFIGGIIAYGVLSLYWKERSVRYKLISGGIFCLLIFISALPLRTTWLPSGMLQDQFRS